MGGPWATSEAWLGEEITDGTLLHAEAEVQGARVQPLPNLRTQQGLLPEVRHLPDLLPDPFPAGPDPGRHEGELVASRVREGVLARFRNTVKQGVDCS